MAIFIFKYMGNYIKLRYHAVEVRNDAPQLRFDALEVRPPITTYHQLSSAIISYFLEEIVYV